MSSFELTLSMAIVSVVLMVGSLAVSSDGVSLLRGDRGAGLTAASWLPIVTNSLGGILVGQVTKHMGGVSKGFSIVGGLVVCGVVQVRAACHDFSLGGLIRFPTPWTESVLKQSLRV
jgi:UDP-sugar transporter A1/2/3